MSRQQNAKRRSAVDGSRPIDRAQPGLGRRWAVAAVAAAAVICVVEAVQVATGGSEPTNLGVGSQPAPAGVAIVTAGDPALPGDAGPVAGGLAKAADLFATDSADSPDVVRETAVDLAGAWPVSGCAAAAGADAGRVDFVSGVEHGPEYSRDLAISWYVDEAAAVAAYDGLVARIATCAADAGAVLTAGTPDAAVAPSVSTVAVPIDASSAEASLYAADQVGAVVVLAVDHAVFYGGSEAAADTTAGTSAQAERLVSAACNAAPDRC